MNAAIALPPEMASFIQGGVSITLAGRDERLVPSIAKGVGCHVSPARDAVSVFTFADTAEALLRDVALTRRVAVAFSQPSTNRTLQLKGCDAAVQPAQPADVAQARRYLALFAAEIVPLGWPPDFAQAVLWHEPAGLMAVRFTPEGAFHQTPGPGAGAPLPLQGGRA